MAMLDRIVLGRGLTLTRAGVLDTALARQASDHLPIWGDIAGAFGPVSAPTNGRVATATPRPTAAR